MQVLDQANLGEVELGDAMAALAQLDDALAVEQRREKLEVAEVVGAERTDGMRVAADPGRPDVVLRWRGNAVRCEGQLGVGQQSRRVLWDSRGDAERHRVRHHAWSCGPDHLDRERIVPGRSVAGMQHSENDPRRTRIDRKLDLILRPRRGASRASLLHVVERDATGTVVYAQPETGEARRDSVGANVPAEPQRAPKRQRPRNSHRRDAEALAGVCPWPDPSGPQAVFASHRRGRVNRDLEARTAG